MAQYNLNRNGAFTTVTGTGYGNKQLSWAELEKLIDGNTSSSGISLSGSDVLYMETDLSNRIKIDGVNIYTSNPSISGAVYFYYKNTSEASYNLLNTNVNGSTYSTTIPTPSAPRFIAAVISGVVCDVYEYEIFNDDYIVAFGTDGQMYAKYIENAEVGEEGPATEIPIYNNGTGSMPVNAYVCVDWTGNAADYYVDIAENSVGEWFNINDGVILNTDGTDGDYNWSMGRFSDAAFIESDVLTISGSTVVSGVAPTVSGIYTTPVFKFNDKYKSSYFVVNAVTESGVNTVSYDEDMFNGTIRVRSSSIEPVESNIVFVGYRTGSGNHNIAKMDINNGDYIYPFTTNFATSLYAIRAAAVCRRTGKIACAGYYSATYVYDSFIYIFDKDGVELYYLFVGNTRYTSNLNLEFDSAGGLWGYSTEMGYSLFHYNSSLSSELYRLTESYDFCRGVVVEIDGEGVWYINITSESIVHLDSDGSVLASVALSSPLCIASASSGACWVFDSDDRKFYKYDSIGNLLKSKSVDHTATLMTTDYEEGFWYLASGYLYHVNEAGVTTTKVNVGSDVYRLKSGYGGCAAYSKDSFFVKWVNKGATNVYRNFDLSGLSSYSTSFPGVFPINYNSYKTMHLSGNLFPRLDDPVWGNNGTLKWKEVSKDGYFLPKTNYHQAQIKLIGKDIPPSVNSIVMSPAIKIQDIPSKNSSNMYIRSNVPSSGNIEDYDAKLKCWWGIKE